MSVGESKNIEIVLLFLFLLIVSIIPIDIDGCFRTIKIVQDNLRPFIVVSITFATTIYLKVYDDLCKKTDKDIELYKKSFQEAYEQLQEEIKKFKNKKLEEIDPKGNYIKTDLRILMMYEKINEKCDFFKIYENFSLWRRPKKMYACDFKLDNGKILLQDCLEEILEKNNGAIKMDYAYLEGIQFRNVDIYDECVKKIYAVGTNFNSVNFSNSKICFSFSDGNEDKCRNMFKKIKLNNSEIYFNYIFEEIGIIPNIAYINAEKSTLQFNIEASCLNTKIGENENECKMKSCELIRKEINSIIDDSFGDEVKESRFTFVFDGPRKDFERKLYSGLKEIEKELNKKYEENRNKFEILFGLTP